MLEFQNVVTFQGLDHVVYIYICSKVFIYSHCKWLFTFLCAHLVELEHSLMKHMQTG